MIKERILVLDTDRTRYDKAKRIWHVYNYFLDIVSSFEDALLALERQTYMILLVTSDDYISESFFRSVRKDFSVPIIIETPEAFQSMPITNILLGAAEKYDRQMLSTIGRAIGDKFNGELHEHEVQAYGSYFVAVDRRKFFIDNAEITKKEFEVLLYFCRNKGIVLTYDQIYEAIWDDSTYEGARKCVIAVVRRIKNKVLAVRPDTPEYIKNVRSVGYCFDL